MDFGSHAEVQFALWSIPGAAYKRFRSGKTTCIFSSCPGQGTTALYAARCQTARVFSAPFNGARASVARSPTARARLPQAAQRRAALGRGILTAPSRGGDGGDEWLCG